MLEPIPLIKEAMRFAVSKIKEGETPTDALFKTAEKYDLNRHFTERVGEAINVSLHLNHFKVADDKSVDFDVAKIAEVVKKRYQIENVAEKKVAYDLFPITEYEDFIPDLDRALTDRRAKVAFEQFQTPEKEIIYNKIATQRIVKSAMNEVEDLEKTAFDAKGRHQDISIKLATAFSTVIDTFKRAKEYRTSFDEFESQIFAKHGSVTNEYIDEIYKRANLKEDRGVKDDRYWNFELCKEAELFDKFLKTAEEFRTSETSVNEAIAQHKTAKETLDSLKVQIGNLKKADIFKELKKYDQEKKTEETDVEKKANFDFMDMVAKHVQKKFDTSDESSDVGKNVFSDNMERRILIQELMMTDPIISKEPARKVLSAYEQILRVAPELSKQKEVMRMMLREILATQGLNTLTSNSLTEADINLMMHKRMAGGNFEKGRK